MLDFFQKGGMAKWIIAIGIIAVVIYVIYRRKNKIKIITVSTKAETK